MDLLKYEFMDAHESSYNGMLGDLVRKINYYRSKVSGEEFHNAIPSFREIERKLQAFDAETISEKRNYIDEIIQELDEQQELQDKLMEQISRSCSAIIKVLFEGSSFSMDHMIFAYRVSESVPWFLFLDYHTDQQSIIQVKVVKEICMSVCNANKVVFVDLSITVD